MRSLPLWIGINDLVVVPSTLCSVWTTQAFELATHGYSMMTIGWGGGVAVNFWPSEN